MTAVDTSQWRVGWEHSTVMLDLTVNLIGPESTKIQASGKVWEGISGKYQLRVEGSFPE